MNKLIKQQLEACKVASITTFDDNTTHLTIPQFKQVKVDVDECYIIKLDKSLLNPNVNDTFHINWNRGIVPTHEYLLIEISKVVSKTIYVNAVDYDIGNKKSGTNSWSGWLPVEKIEILGRV